MCPKSATCLRNDNIPHIGEHLPGLLDEHAVSSASEKMVGDSTFRGPDARRDTTLCSFRQPSRIMAHTDITSISTTQGRRCVIYIEDSTRFPREALGAAPGHVLQDQFCAEVVEKQVIVARVNMDGDIVLGHEGRKDGVRRRRGRNG